MYIKSLTVDKFRNYTHESLDLCPGTNVFYGDNAQGKGEKYGKVNSFEFHSVM